MSELRKLTVLTGASRGLGRAMGEQLLQPGAMLLAMARRPSTELTTRARSNGAALEQWAIDLADGIAAATKLEQWLRDRDEEFASATLINNAALAGKPRLLADSEAGSLTAVLRVGLEAPVLLSGAFLRATRDWTIPRKILNISSGAGKKPLPGVTTYCAVKAGLDHLSRSLALEEAQISGGAKVVSLAPGVIDTDMQTELRKADPRDFPPQPHFAEMKSSGQLATPDAAAARVLAYLARADFGSNPVADVRDQ
jgi:NAD(P)-dependent dehydrogenase (short-subunit alcohol dehydrogenase family)